MPTIVNESGSFTIHETGALTLAATADCVLIPGDLTNDASPPSSETCGS